MVGSEDAHESQKNETLFEVNEMETTHVYPVVLFTPARNVDTRTASAV